MALMIPKTAILWQLAVAREIILSGFQQDLYASHERPISYWYTAQIIELHLSLIDEFKAQVRKGMSSSARKVSISQMPPQTVSRSLNFISNPSF